jgi:hypothetical protein
MIQPIPGSQPRNDLAARPPLAYTCGLRVIYFWDGPSETFYLLYAYPKNVQENLTAQQLRVLARLVREEFG